MKINSLFKGMTQRREKWSKSALELYNLELQYKALKKIKDEKKAELVELSKGVASYDKNGFVFKPTEIRGSVNYGLIPYLKEIDLEPYRRDGFTKWKVEQVKLVKEEK